MKCYVAGPMRGYDRYNFVEFDKAKDWLIEQGWDVTSPADIDRAEGITGYTQVLPPGFMHAVMRRDFQAICECDAVVFLKGWEKSTGSNAERFVGEQIGLAFFHIDTDTGVITPESEIEDVA
jgi:hypothetical protein